MVTGGPTYSGDEIVIGGPNRYDRSYFYLGDFEVWTFIRADSINPVPDTAGTAGLLGVALLALAVFRRRVA